MNVLFIYPVNPPEFFTIQFSQGIGFLSAALRKQGHKTDLLLLYELDLNKIGKKIETFKPGLIAISSVTDQIELSKRIINYIDGKHKIPVILGGIHPTVLPEESIKIPSLLGICIGEADEALPEFVNLLEKKKDYTKVKNFWFKKGDKVIRNEVRPLIQDLDVLPFPDRSIFDGYIKYDGEFEFMGSRGCPFLCTYCINSFMMKLYKGKGRYVRYRSVDNLLKEIEETRKKYNVTSVMFDDDTFILNKEWLREFADKYPKCIGIPFVCNARADVIDEEIVKLLRKAGCFEVKFGVESGNEFIRSKILKRPMTNQQIISAFRLAKRFGLKATAFNMLGLPCETEKTIWDTIKLNREINPYRMGASIFRPYPGTESYDLCNERCWISNRKVRSYFDELSMLDQPSISKEKVNYYYKIFRISAWHPKIAPLFRFMARTKVYRNKSIYDILLDTKSYISSRLTRKQRTFLMKYFKWF